MAATENQASPRSALPKSPHFQGIATDRVIGFIGILRPTTVKAATAHQARRERRLPAYGGAERPAPISGILTAMFLVAVQAAAPPFNADFYVAAATIIPVLYLAIAVQRDAVRGLARVAVDAVVRSERQPPGSRGALAANAVVLAVIAALVLIALAGAGEALAIIALFLRRAPLNFGAIVLASVLILAATALGLGIASVVGAAGEAPAGQR